ncbi:TPA: conjugative transfer relaxase/helicase TraI [Escherichia coli]
MARIPITLLDGAARHNVQVLITDSGQRTGTGSALMAMKDAGVNTYRWQGGEQRPATIISEPDRNVRYARLAGDFAASVKAGEESVAQVSGVREQAILTQAIRSELKTQGVLGRPEVTMTALSPVWLDSRSRYLRDMYRPGMVMEQWNPETRSHDRYVIDRVTAQSNSLTLRDAQDETQVVRISSLDSSWSLFRPEKMPVADGERLRVTGKIPGLRVSGGDRLQVASVSEDAMTVVVPGRAEPASLPVSDSPFMALKLENGWVETPGHSVSDSAKVFASVTQMAMDNATLNGLARSGRDVRLYSSLDETRTAEKLARHPSFTVVSEQIKARAGETLLETAISLQKTGLHTPAQQAIHLALPVVESKNLAFSMVDLLTEAKSFAAEGTSFTELGGEINAQIKRGDLLYVDVAKGYGTGLLVSRASYEAEKSILRHILEGKEAVTPLMERVPGELMEKLTSGQRAATRMILETSDRFTVVQGYAGVGKTTQFRAVMSAVNMLPESERPRVVGLGPTHRAVGEMRSAGVDAQTLASFLHDTQLLQRSGETPNFSNTLFLLDESSMVGNTDMARAYALIAAGGGRAVASGDTDQLQAIAPGQPFRLQQTRSAADVVIMKEIVRQTPELREAVYSLINRDVERALSGLESVKPSQVPRQEGAWAPEHSVTEFSHSQEAKLAEAQQKAMLKGEAFPDIPMTLYEAIVRDYTGRTPEAREQTLIVTHLNEDRRVLNSMIHDAREKAGELGKEQVMVPVLNTANIRDGELRRLSTWENNPDALALVDSVYHRIAGISKDDGLITLEDAEGNTRLISPREAVAEGVTLYTPDTIRVGTGDRMRFTKSDRERGYVANSVWTVTAVSGDSVTLSDGQQTRVIRPGQERAEQHIDLAYAITAHGAQGASETFAIALEGTEGIRNVLLPSFANAFTEAGFATITFDYRGFGESEGERGRLVPAMQTEDIISVINWAEKQVCIDNQRIGLWGTSLGGCHVFNAAAQDKRVKSIVSQLAFADGEVLVTGEMNELEKASFLSTLNKMAEKKKNTGKEMFVGVTRVLSDNESKVFFEKVKGQYPEMDIKIPFLTVMETLQYKPAESAAKVQCPVLVVIAGQDSVNPPEQGRALYDAVASGTKELYEEADACHYDIYKGAFFERVAAVQTQWFKKHL